MEQILYLYDISKLDDFKNDFHEYTFCGFGAIFNSVSNLKDLMELDADEFADFVIDLTSLAYDHNYFKIFIEQYIYCLVTEFKNILFCVKRTQKEIFIEKYPFVFDIINDEYIDDEKEEQIELSSDIINLSSKYTNKISILSYSQCSLEEHNTISISYLLSNVQNLGFEYKEEYVTSILNLKEIKNIDISSFFETIQYRKDLRLSFEIILKNIKFLKEDINFVISDDNIEELKSYFPFTFEIYDNDLNMNKDKGYIENNIDVNKITNELTKRLKGHILFKEDFTSALKKYFFLNNLQERNILSVFLAGESGVGKTEFAKILSNIMYPSEKLIKINFGNYTNEGVLNSLIGSPIGYVGSDEGGELINKIKNSKTNVVLIDEFEKATPSVFNFFYELLEDGRFTDRHGVEHDMNGYIVIFTSNMTNEMYKDYIPDPLKSRFDMVYRFGNLQGSDKIEYIDMTTQKLINLISNKRGVTINSDCITIHYDNLLKLDNLRSMKRKIQEIIVDEYYNLVEK